MSFWTVMLISLAIGLLLIIGGTLVMYVGSLVKNAYELKVEMQNDMNAGMQRLEEETEKKTRWIKRDIVEEVEKIRAALQTENQKRMNETAEMLGRKLTELDTAWKANSQDVAKVLDSFRQDILRLDQRQRSLKRDLTATAEPQAAAPSPEAPTPAAMAAQPTPAAMAAQPTPPAPEPPAAT
ncbi:hypothetical protein GALL_316870 [mine drainage metagenome]|uniref:Uncharacterized protein n=1 Tax=mine drainage metagenome TaxID=410659 RepID=A0A1J5RE72_9ZZZZ